MIPLFLRSTAAAVSLLLVACGGASSDNGAAKSDQAGKAEAGAPSTGKDMVIGSPDAPITIIEYASVTCPHCATFHETVLPAIKEEYIETGKAKLIFREFPTPPAEFSYIGSVLARCAGEKSGPDAYFVVIDALMRTQRTWIFGEDPKSELLKIASQVGMDEASFDACLKRQDLVDQINARVDEASEEFGINSTPSFIINGEKAAVQGLEDFKEKLDAELAGAAG